LWGLFSALICGCEPFAARFPVNFVFPPEDQEVMALKCQNGTSKKVRGIWVGVKLIS